MKYFTLENLSVIDRKNILTATVPKRWKAGKLYKRQGALGLLKCGTHALSGTIVAAFCLS
jgi:hypothetical protein